MRQKFNLLILLALSLSLPVQAAPRLPIKVARFQVNGPESAGYLSSAAQDAVVGALLQQGADVQGLDKELDPDKLNSVKAGGKDTGLLVTGRIQVVGSTYRVLVRWIDQQGVVGQQYLTLDSLNALLPGLENFAAKELPRAPVAVTQKEEKEVEKSSFEREMVPPPASDLQIPAPPPAKPSAKAPSPAPAKATPQVVKAPEPEKPKSAKSITKKTESKKDAKREIPLRDYNFVSERLPFEVRSIAYGDVNQDGQNEVLLTSQKKLYLYSFSEGKLELLSEYPGGSLDYFVKVDLWRQDDGSPLVVLTSLRTDHASSKILRVSNNHFVPVVENIPYMLRVVRTGSQEQLMGANYSASTHLGKQAIFPLALSGNQVSRLDRVNLPFGTQLYTYDWVAGDPGGTRDVVVLSPEGKLRLYHQESQDKYKKAWTSRESYGGTGNYVPVEVKDFFNEVVSDFYPIPVGVTSYDAAGRPEVVVVKNSSLVKDVIGRVPVIADGQFFRLTYDQLGFVEAWASKKVDGSIQDYLVTSADGRPQLMAAVRLRDPGLFGEMGRNDSVILLYDLN